MKRISKYNFVICDIYEIVKIISGEIKLKMAATGNR